MSNPNDIDEEEGALDLSIFNPRIEVEYVGKYIEPYLPTYGSEKSAGADVRADIPEAIELFQNGTVIIPTGLKFGIAPGFEIQVRSRSGLAAKHGLFVANSPGTVDEDYTGEVKIILSNIGGGTYTIQPGDKIAQLIVAPYFQGYFTHVDVVHETARGDGGFGSTGYK